MEIPDFETICAKIAALDAWETAYPWNWAVVPRGARRPVIVSPQKGEDPRIKTRLMLFPGWKEFARYRRFQAKHAASPEFSPADVDHEEVVFPPDGASSLLTFFPGYLPRIVPGAEAGDRRRRILWETFGMMMRIEEDPSLPVKYGDDGAMFSRREGPGGEWADAPLPLPRKPAAEKRSVSLSVKKIAAAKAFAAAPGEAWEAAFTPYPGMHTRGPDPRTCYVLAAAGAESGREIATIPMSVEPVRDPDGLLRLWDSLAGRLLDLMVSERSVPRELRFSDARLLAAVRPLGMNLPFKMTVCKSLPHARRALEKFPFAGLPMRQDGGQGG